MINNEWKQVRVRSVDTLNEYGQKVPNQAFNRTIEMMVKVYSQEQINNPKYTNIELVGLTTDLTLTDSDQVEVDGKIYNVFSPLKTRKYLQVFLKNE